MKSDAFTRVELLATLAGIALCAAVALPCLGANTASSKRTGCFNNLRQIGRAVNSWESQHNEQTPWSTSVSEGGTKSGFRRPGNAWFEYLALSNDLNTPTVLACPADDRVKAASGWGNGTGGLAHMDNRGSAISYSIGMHASVLYPYSLISADRNMRFRGRGTGCSVTYMNNPLETLRSPYVPPTIWTNAVHGTAGHLVSMDGSVRFVDSAALNTTLMDSRAEGGGSMHVLGAQ